MPIFLIVCCMVLTVLWMMATTSWTSPKSIMFTDHSKTSPKGLKYLYDFGMGFEGYSFIKGAMVCVTKVSVKHWIEANVCCLYLCVRFVAFIFVSPWEVGKKCNNIVNSKKIE